MRCMIRGCGCRIGNCFFFFFNDTATTEIYTLSLHDALPIYDIAPLIGPAHLQAAAETSPELEKIIALHDHVIERSEEHTSELQSRQYLVCRLLLEKKKKCSRLPTLCPFSTTLRSHNNITPPL